MRGEAGLQAERTALSWSRTALGLVVNAVLALVRHPLDSALSPALGGASLVMAVVVVVIGRRRARTLTCVPLPTGLAPSRAVLVLGWGTAVLGVAALVAIASSHPS